MNSENEVTTFLNCHLNITLAFTKFISNCYKSRFNINVSRYSAPKYQETQFLDSIA